MTLVGTELYLSHAFGREVASVADENYTTRALRWIAAGPVLLPGGRMAHVDTLFVVPCPRSPHFCSDLASSLAWSCRRPYEVVVTAPWGRPAAFAGAWHKAPLEGIQPGFWANHAIAHALRQKLTFRACVICSDESLVLRPGLDDWVHTQWDEKSQIGLIGVRDRDTHVRSAVGMHSVLHANGLDQSEWDTLPATICDDFVAVSYDLAKEMVQRDLLVPSKRLAEWPASYGAYMACAAAMLGFRTLLWGANDRARPPLYVNSSYRWRLLPPPDILSAAFLFYARLSCVQGMAEEDVREAWRAARAESYRDTSAGAAVMLDHPDTE